MEDGPPRFPQGFPCPAVLGNIAGRQSPFTYRAVTLYGGPFQALRLELVLCNSPPAPHSRLATSHNPERTTRVGLHTFGLGFSRFARHYSGNSVCFLFLGVLRCFTSPSSLPQAMYSPADNRTFLRLGFPIRTSPDQSLFSNSPRLFAAYHVLHRLLTPRHPPVALSSLTITPERQNRMYLERYSVFKERTNRTPKPALEPCAKRCRWLGCPVWWRIPGSNR